jgi:hypothetical protein
VLGAKGFHISCGYGSTLRTALSTIGVHFSSAMTATVHAR